MQWPVKYPHLYRSQGARHCGILLTGPPGNGKTLVAKVTFVIILSKEHLSQIMLIMRVIPKISYKMASFRQFSDIKNRKCTFCWKSISAYLYKF